MTRDEIISGLKAVVRDVRKEPDEKMLGVCITADEAEEIAKLLKEQEPKQVLSVADSVGEMDVGYCPSCRRGIANKMSDPTKFCRYCGQAVKWD